MGPVCYVDVPVTVQHHVRVFFESKEAVLLDAWQLPLYKGLLTFYLIQKRKDKLYLNLKLLSKVFSLSLYL